MATKTTSKKAISALINQAHRASYATFSEMFLEKHYFQQGRVGTTGGLYITHGYKNDDDDIIPISTLVVGERLKNKQALRQVGALSIARLVRQSFLSNQAWLADDVQVPIKKFMEHVSRFLMDNEQHLDVFSDIYENKLTNTNVFGLYILLKDAPDDATRFAWQITIDDHDLVDALDVNSMFLGKTK